jgi:hypothetical protein
LGVRLALLAVVLLCFSSVVQGADFSKVGPQASAAEIMSQRQVAGIPLLKIAFDEVRDGKPHSIRLAIAPDFIVVDDGQLRTIFDYALRRRIVADASRKTFVNGSLYAVVDFAYREAANRRYQRSLLNKVGATHSADLANPFWGQAELHLAPTDDEPFAIDRKEDAAGATRFFVAGEDVANFRLSDTTLDPREVAGFRHFLLAYPSLHPAIAKTLSEAGRLPAYFAYAYSRGGQRGGDTWTLKSFERVTGSYPLPAEYRPEVKIDSPAVNPLMPQLLAAIAKRAAPRSLASLRGELETALAQSQPLQGYVFYLQMLLQYGQGALACPEGAQHCTPGNEIGARLSADPAVASLLEASNAEAAGDFKQALDLRLGVKRDGLSDSYVFDDLVGNTYAESGDFASAVPLIARAIAGNPFIAAYYKDLGDVFAADFDSFNAWTLYDLARALPGGENAPVVDAVTANEQALAAAYPQFF